MRYLFSLNWMGISGVREGGGVDRRWGEGVNKETLQGGDR